RWRARHRLHTQGDAARMPQRADSVQGNASLHSSAGEKRGVPAGGNSGEPSFASLWTNEIQLGQSRRTRDHGYVRRAVAALTTIELQNSGVNPRMRCVAKRACQAMRYR